MPVLGGWKLHQEDEHTIGVLEAGAIDDGFVEIPGEKIGGGRWHNAVIRITKAGLRQILGLTKMGEYNHIPLEGVVLSDTGHYLTHEEASNIAIYDGTHRYTVNKG